jgi:hypothetical protein
MTVLSKNRLAISPILILKDGTIAPPGTPENDENVATVIPKIDLSMGASASLRAKVGNRDNPEERLAIIKQFYPDAIPTSKTINIQTDDPNDSSKKITKKVTIGDYLDIGNDNFIYTDIVDGKEVQKVYNEKGLSAGDVASFGRTIAENVGGSLAGTVVTVLGQLGPQALTPEEIYTVPAAIALGSEKGGQIYDRAIDMLITTAGKELVSRGKMSSQIIKMLSNIGIEAAGIRSVDALVEAGRKVTPKIGQLLLGIGKQSKEKAKELTKKAASLGLKIPTIGLATQSPTVQFVEKVMINSPLGVGAFTKKVKEFNEGVSNAVRTIGNKYGSGNVEKDIIGKRLLGGVQDYAEKVRRETDRLYGKLDTVFPNRVNTPSIQGVKDELEDDLAEGGIKSAITPVLNIVSDLQKASKNKEGLTILTLHKRRSELLSMLRNTKSEGMNNEVIRKSIGKAIDAIERDMRSGIEAVGSKKALKAYENASKYVRETKGELKGSLNDILDFGDSEKFDRIFNLAIGPSALSGGGEKIKKIVKNLKPEDRNELASSVLFRLGVKNPDGTLLEEGFSPNTFITNWGKISKSAKDEIFGTSGLRKNIDDLSDILKSYLSGEKYENFSRTGNAIGTLALVYPLFSGIGGATGAAIGGTVGGVIGGGGMATMSFSPYLMSKLLTSETFMKSIVDGGKEVFRKPNLLGTWSGRLLDDMRKEAERTGDSSLIDATEVYLHQLLFEQPIDEDETSEVKELEETQTMAQAQPPKETPQQQVGNVQVTQPNINITPPTSQPPRQMASLLPNTPSVGGGITSVGKKEQFGGLFPTDNIGKLIANRKT